MSAQLQPLEALFLNDTFYKIELHDKNIRVLCFIVGTVFTEKFDLFLD